MLFSKSRIDHESLEPVTLNGIALAYTNSVTYLGTNIVNDKGFSFSCENDLVKFYRASNSILAAANKPSEEILLQLLYSNCIPTLSYACAVKEYPSRQIQNCNVPSLVMLCAWYLGTIGGRAYDNYASLLATSLSLISLVDHVKSFTIACRIILTLLYRTLLEICLKL